MKYVIIAATLVFALGASVCAYAENGVKDEISPDSATALRTHIDLDDEQGGPSRVGTMSPGQSYDEETGMPDMTESDSDMELD